MDAFADTGFICPVHAPDANTGPAISWLSTNRNPLPFTGLHRLEFRNVLRLRVFRKRNASARAIRNSSAPRVWTSCMLPVRSFWARSSLLPLRPGRRRWPVRPACVFRRLNETGASPSGRFLPARGSRGDETLPFPQSPRQSPPIDLSLCHSPTGYRLLPPGFDGGELRHTAETPRQAVSPSAPDLALPVRHLAPESRFELAPGSAPEQGDFAPLADARVVGD